MAVDLLHLNGRDMTAQPQTKRGAALQTRLRPVPLMGAATWSPIIRDPADEAMALMCGNGVIAERTDAPIAADTAATG